MALRQPRAAILAQAARLHMPLKQEPEPLEDGTIAESLGIVDQRIVIAVLVFQVCLQAVGNMLNTTAASGIVEHVDHGAVNVGDEDSRLPPPDRPGAEDLPLMDVM